MASGESAERMQSLHDSRALRPPGACARGERDGRHFAATNRIQSRSMSVRQPSRRVVFEAGRTLVYKIRIVEDVVVRDILDHRARRQTILRKPDAAFLQVGADLLVLRA